MAAYITQRRIGMLSAAIFLCASLSFAAPSPRRVLLLHSFDATFSPAKDFRTELARQSAAPIEFLDAWLTADRLSANSEQSIVEDLRSKYQGHSLDLIVAMSGPAVAFAQKYRQQLFPATPMLLTAVDRRLVRSALLTANDTAVPVTFEPSGTIEQILMVRPQTSHILVVLGASALEQFWRSEMNRELQRFNGRLTFVWPDNLSFQDLLRQAATLPQNSAIFFVLWSVDREGVQMTQERVLTELHAAANAPIFGFSDSQLGQGVVGAVMSLDAMNRNAAAVAVRILRGESPGAIKFEPQTSAVFDWRELRRWNISEARLPAGSRIEFREPTLWGSYKPYIIGSLALMLTQTALIAGLLIQRSKRRRAELKLSGRDKQLRASYERIRHLGRSLVGAQETERARVAREMHDDINQQLAILSIDLEALRHDRHQVDREERLSLALERTHAVSKTVHDLSHRLHPPTLELLGLVPAIANLKNDFSRSNLSIAFSHRDVPKVVERDVALCLFRVVQEALNNAVKHSDADHAWVDLAMVSAGLELTVADDGKGFDVNGASSDGLGLISMRERVEWVGGVLEIHSTQGSGTRLRATVPIRARVDDGVAPNTISVIAS